MRVVRCVLPHTQRCHEPKACTSPAKALYFSSKQTATATADSWCASVEQVGTGGEGRRRGGAVNHILPPLVGCFALLARIHTTPIFSDVCYCTSTPRSFLLPLYGMLGPRPSHTHYMVPFAPLGRCPCSVKPRPEYFEYFELEN